MLTEIILEAWIALRRNYTRSLLTMLGIVWGIATVTLLIAYGSSFRRILVGGFDAFGKSVVICWPQQTSEQPGGQRAGKKVVLEQADLDMVKETAPLVKHVCLETVNRPGISYGDAWWGRPPSAGFARSMARCATKSRPKGAGFPPETNWSAGAWSFSAAGCASNCSAAARRWARPCRSAACTSP